MTSPRNLVPELIREQHKSGQPAGCFDAAVLYVDLAGFTTMTETLCRHNPGGAETLSEVLDEIFAPLVQYVYGAGGFIPLFAGDAFAAIFPGENQPAAAARFAWQTAAFVWQHLHPNQAPRQLQTNYGVFAVSAKIGLSFGPVVWGIPGSDGRYTFYFRGPAMNRAAAVERRAGSGQILAHRTFLDHFQAGAVQVEHLDSSCARLTPAGTPPPVQPVILTPVAADLLPFVPNSIVDLPVTAEFREVCPVFISFQAPASTAALHKWIAILLKLCQRYGGTFNQLEFGDKGAVAVLLFGAPARHENDLARAAACLLSLRRYDLTLAEAPRWRAGLSHGLVWAGFRGSQARYEYGAIGDPVNTAARIAFTAPWDAIWLDEAAAGELRRDYDLDSVGTYALKGQSVPRRLFQLTKARIRLDVMYQGRLIGRRRELRQMYEAIAPIYHGRWAGVVTVNGEAGMGKSRLIHEFRQQTEDRVHWLICPTDEILRQSLNPFRFRLAQFFNQGERELAATNETRFAARFDELLAQLKRQRSELAAAVAAELLRTRSALAALVGIDQPDSSYARLEPSLRHENSLLALRAWIRALALQKPLIINLEDIHWLDKDSRAFVLRLTYDLPGYPVAIFCSSRFGDNGRRVSLSLAPMTPQLDLDLPEFDVVGIGAIAEQILGQKLAPAAARLLMQKSGGRPFFAEQLILDLQERGALTAQNGTLGIMAAAESDIPATINGLLLARLDRLAPNVKLVVQTAAVLGERFSVPVLAATIQADNQLPAQLQAASLKQIWQIEGDLRYLFKHALLRDAAYHMQLKSQRRRLHEQAAASIIRLHQSSLARHYNEIAYHYEAAYLLGLGQVRRLASRYLHLAARRAAADHDTGAALDFYRRALALLQESEWEWRFDLLRDRMGVLELMGQHQQWQADLEQLRAIADEVAENARPALEAEVNRLWALYSRGMGEYEKSRQLARKALAFFHRQHDYKMTAYTTSFLATIAWLQGDYQQARQQLEVSLKLQQHAPDPEQEAVSWNLLGMINADEARYLSAWTCYEHALTLKEKISPRLGAAVYNNIGEILTWLGAYPLAEQYVQHSLALVQEVSLRTEYPMRFVNLGIIALNQNRFDAARQYLRDALNNVEHRETLRVSGCAWHNLGQTYLAEGNLTAARENFIHSLSIRRKLGQMHFITEDMAALAVVNYRLGRESEAQTALTAVLDDLERAPQMHGAYKPLQVYSFCVEMLRPRDPERARAIWRQALRLLQQRALAVDDPQLRRSFLFDVPENRQLPRLYAS